jgi:hypothetical protein
MIFSYLLYFLPTSFFPTYLGSANEISGIVRHPIRFSNAASSLISLAGQPRRKNEGRGTGDGGDAFFHVSSVTLQSLLPYGLIKIAQP